MFKGLLFIIAIIIFSILTILCFIFGLIYLINSKKGKFGWVGGFVFSLIGLIVSVFLLANGIANKVFSFTNNLQQSFGGINQNMIDQIDTAQFKTYLVPDSLNNGQIKDLKSLESEEIAGNVPPQFYNYLGFKDYYRLPLKFPFSLHCADSLNNASLFNEGSVTSFNESNNGEVDCNVNGITEFTFDNHFFLAKHQDKFDDKKSVYIIYNFDTAEFEEFENLNKLILKATKLKFSNQYKFFNCKDYYDGFYK